MGVITTGKSFRLMVKCHALLKQHKHSVVALFYETL